MTDPRGDVRLTAAEGPSRASRRSIDLREVTVRRVGTKVRFEVTLVDVSPRLRFDQMVFIDLRPASSSGSDKEGTIGFTSKERYAYTFWGSTTDYDDYVTCDPLRSQSLPARDVMYLDVPRRCLPDEPVRLSVSTASGQFRSDAPTFSSDRARRTELVDLRALLAP